MLWLNREPEVSPFDPHGNTRTVINNSLLFKYKVHQDTTYTSYIQDTTCTFGRDIEISLILV